MTEMIHDARIVPIGSSKPLDNDIRLWTGDSRGYWDADTLVVETRNFNSLTQSLGVYGTSKDKLLTERFTRVGKFTVEYEFTVDDSTAYKDIWKGEIALRKSNDQIYEYACHEGNHGMVGILAGARAVERMQLDESGQ